MRKLLLRPNSSSYTVEPGNEVVATDVAGGPSRSRRDFIGMPTKVNVAWWLDEDSFMYLNAFFNTVLQKGSLPFLMDLLIDKPYLTEHTCKFSPGSFKPVASTTAFTFTATCVLEVQPLPVNETFDLEVIDTYETTGGRYDGLSVIARIANIYMPDALE